MTKLEQSKMELNLITNEKIKEHFNDLIKSASYMIESFHETPFTLFSLPSIYNNIKKILEVKMSSKKIKITFGFAVKSCYLTKLLKFISSFIDIYDVQSIEEISLCPLNSKISYHSPNLDLKKLNKILINQLSLNSDAQVVNVLSSLSLKELNKIRYGFRIEIPLLIKDQFISQNSKFGIPISNVIKYMQKNWPNKSELFLHNHSFSRLNNSEKALRITMTFCKLVKKISFNSKQEIYIVNIGGGWDGGFELFLRKMDIADLLNTQINCIKDSLPAINEIIIEPGRFIFEDTCILVTKIVDVFKKGRTSFVVVDVGTNFLIPLTLARYKVIGLNTIPIDTLQHFTIVDGTCSPRGLICEQWLPYKLRQGMYLGIINCGSYTYSLASFFYSHLPSAFALTSNNNLINILSYKKILENQNAIYK